VPTKLLDVQVNELETVDVASSSKSWDRRRRGEGSVYAATFLEHAATYLIEDQMNEERTYWPGAVDAVRLLRKSIEGIESDELMNQRAGRAAAAWLPKHVLARQARDGISDA
jgi:hypothetical protein